jgi:hypothetical protein
MAAMLITAVVSIRRLDTHRLAVMAAEQVSQPTRVCRRRKSRKTNHRHQAQCNLPHRSNPSATFHHEFVVAKAERPKSARSSCRDNRNASSVPTICESALPADSSRIHAIAFAEPVSTFEAVIEAMTARYQVVLLAAMQRIAASAKKRAAGFGPAARNWW